MANDLDIVIKTLLEADEKESASKIISQLPNIEKAIQSKSKLKIQLETDSSNISNNVQKAIEQVNREFSSAKLKNSFKLNEFFEYNKQEAETIFRQFNSYVKELDKLAGFQNAKYTFKTDADNYVNSAKVTYYNDALKQVVVESYELDKANEEAENSLSRLILKTREYSSDINAYQDSLKAQIKLEQQLINGKAVLAKQMDVLNTKAAQSKVSLDPVNQENFQSGLQNVTSLDDLRNLSSMVKVARLELQELNASVSKDWASSALEGLNKKIANMSSGVEILKIKYEALGDVKPFDIDSSFDHVKESMEQINRIDDPKEKIQAYNKLSQEVVQLSNQYKVLTNEERLATNQQKLLSDKSILSNRVQSWMKQNTKAAKMYSRELSEILEKIQNVTNTKEYSAVQKKFQQIQTHAKAQGLLGSSALDKLKNDMAKFVDWLGASTLVMTGINSIRNAVIELKEVDTILTEISKTSERTASSLKQLGESAFEAANLYGATATGYLLGVQEMSRAGFGEKQSEELARLSILAQSAGDMTAELANEYLIATNFAYGYQGSVERLNAVLDSQNQITNRNAVNLTEMAEATKVAANMLAQAGIEENQMSALLATGLATTQQSGQEIGRAVKAIVQNLQQISGITEDGETLDESSFKKIEARLASVGVAMEEVVNGAAQLRDPIDILNELAQVYNSLPDNNADKVGIINDLGGKYRSNVLSSILSNWDTYEKMLADYENATGSAEAEAEKTANSLEGRLNRLNNSWTAFVQNFANTDLMKDGVSLFEGIIQGADTLTSSLGPIPTLIGAITAAMSLSGKNAGIFTLFGSVKSSADSTKQSLTFLGKEWGTILKSGLFTSQKKINRLNAESDLKENLTKDKEALTAYNNELGKNTPWRKAFEEHLSNASEAAKKLAREANGTSVSVSEFATSQQAAINSLEKSTIKAKAASAGMKLLSSALNVGITMVASAALTGFISLIDNLIHANERAIEKANELTQAYKDSSKEILDNKEKISSFKEEFSVLSQGVDDNQKNIGLSAEQYERYKEIVSQIVELNPSLIQGYNDENVAIVNRNTLIEDAIRLQEELNEAKRQEYLADIDSVLAGAKAEVDKAEKELKSASSESSGRSLANLLSDGAFDKQGHNPGAARKLMNDTKAVLNSIGVDYEKLANNSFSEMQKVIQMQDQIIERVAVQHGMTDQERIKIKDAIELMKLEFTELDSAIQKGVDPLKKYVEDRSWYKNLTDNGFLNEYNSALKEMYMENRNASSDKLKVNAIQIGEAFEEIQSKIPLDDLEKLHQQYDQGKIDSKTYNAELLKHVNNLDLLANSYRNSNPYVANFIQSISNKERDFVTANTSITNIAASLDVVKQSIQSVSNEYSVLNEVLANQSAGMSLSTDSLSNLLAINQDYASCLEYNNSTIQLNAEKARELANAQSEEALATLEATAAHDKAKYLQLAREIDQLTSAEQDQIDMKRLEMDALEQNINQYDLLKSNIQEATGAYRSWLDAQSGPEAGDMYTDAQSALQAIEEGLNSGKVGSKKYKAAVEFLVPDEVSQKGEQAVQSYMKSLNRYLVEENGGVDNFLEDAIAKGLMTEDSNGQVAIAANKTMSDFVEQLKITPEMARAIFGELEEYNFNFNWQDESFDNMGDAMVAATKTIQELQDKISELNSKPVKTDADTEELKRLNAELKQAENTLKELQDVSNVRIQTYIENQPKIQELQAQIDQLESKPVEIRTSSDQSKLKQLKEELSELKSKIQEVGGTPTEVEIQAHITDIDSQISSLKNKIAEFKIDVEGNPISLNVQVSQLASSMSQLQDLENQKQKIQAIYELDTTKSDQSLENTQQKVTEINDSVAKPKVLDIKTDSTTNRLQGVINYLTTIQKKINTINQGKLPNPPTPPTSSNGKSQLSGNAKANGGTDVPAGQRTLVGELGREIVVDPYSGKWRTVGDNGPEFVRLPKDAIVFNHLQTEELLERGFVNQRGTALVSGNAMVAGGGNRTNTQKGTQYAKNQSSKSNASKAASNAAKQASKEATEAQEWENKALEDYLKLLQHRINMGEFVNKEMDLLNAYLYAYNNLLNKQKDKQEDIWSLEEKIYQARKEAQEADFERQKEALELQKEQLERYKERAELQKQGYENTQDDYDRVISHVTKTLDKKIEALEKQKDALSDETIKGSYGWELKQIEDQTSAIDQQINALQDANDERRRTIDLEKAQAELERAKTQRTNLIYREGQGFVYEADTDAIQDAASEVDQLKQEKKIADLEKQKEQLQEEAEEVQKQLEKAQASYDKRIESFQNYKDQWSEISQRYIDEENEILAQQQLGLDWQNSILSQNIITLEDFANRYAIVQASISNATKWIEDTNALIDGKSNEIQDMQDAHDGKKRLPDDYTAPAASQAVTDQNKKILATLQETSEKTKALASSLSTDIQNIYSSAATVQSSQAMDGLMEKLREFSELSKSYSEYSGMQNQNILAVEQSIIKLIDLLTQYRTQWELLTITITTSQTTARNEATLTQQLESTMYNLRVTAMQEFLASYSEIQTQIITIDAAIKSSIQSLIASVNSSADAYNRQAESIRDVISAKEEEAAAKKNKYNGDRTSHYAVGTKSAKRSEYAIVDEQGEEMIVSGRYKFIEKGDTVFPAKATDNLWNFGSDPSRFLREHFKNIAQPQINMNLSPISPTGNTTVQIGDIHLSHVNNADTLSRDIVNRLPGKVLQNLRKR